MGMAGRSSPTTTRLAKLMHEIRVHGQDRRYHHPRLGLNGRLDTLQAAVLLAKLESSMKRSRPAGASVRVMVS
jgi:dTDP-4-amino-4,6-dideoxygalactose transaminase